MSTVEITQEHADRLERDLTYSLHRHHEASKKVRGIGEIPPPENPKSREACQYDFKLFCESYFPRVFYLPWSEDQLRCIEKIETTVIDGALFALAMPRGSGKTALCQTAVVWAQAYGHRRYIYLLSDDQQSAEDSLLSIKTEWEANDELAADFPEVAFPIVAADGITNRFRGQVCYGQRVQCTWGSGEIILPSIQFPNRTKQWARWLNPVKGDRFASINAGIITRTKGITGGIRGAIFKHPLTGELLRPDLFLADDIQTDKIADSPAQISKITRYLESAVQGLAGPGEVISGLMPCTVIQQGDISDTFLDRQSKPRWKGERCAMVVSWPEGISDTEISDDTEAGRLWNEYARHRLTGLQQDGDIAIATEFYAENREAMDNGYRCSWIERFNKSPSLGKNIEISAQQHAMNLRLDNPAVFASEYQNQPLAAGGDHSDIMSPDQIARRTTAIKRNEVPIWCEVLTAFIDIQDEVLFYGVLASGLDYTGVVIDYGTYPEFPHRFFTKSQSESWCHLSRLYFEANPEDRAKGEQIGRKIKAPFEPKIHFALTKLADKLLAKQYRRDDGTVMQLTRLGIDANWGKTTDLVKRFCRYHGDTRLVPMHGRFVGATTKPFDEWQKREGWLMEDQVHAGIEKVSWVIPASKYGIRHILVDTNYYKTFLHNRLATPLGTPGSLVLFNGDREQHEMFAQHLGGSERPEDVTAKGRTVAEWKELPSRHDNDYLDVMVGCLCLASVQGACLKGVGNVMYSPRPKKKRKLSDMWRDKRQ